MNIEREIFKRSKVNFDKLISYGFKKENNGYIYEKLFLDNFKVIIYIDGNSVTGKIIDLDFNSEYINYRIESQNNEFVNRVREEYKNILKDIFNNCYDKEYFIFSQSNRITNLIKDKYNVDPEFLWDNLPGCGVFRNIKNNKWFGIIMNIDKSKIIPKLTGEVEVLNVKLDDKVEEYLKKDGIFNAYHMNKKSWVSIILDDTLTDKEVFDLIDISYNILDKK